MRSETERSATSQDEIKALQLARLRAGMTVVLATNRFWRERLHDVAGWDDFEGLPLTVKGELLADQGAHPPFGSTLTHPLERYARLHQTSGSSGDQPLRWLDTAESWDWWLRIWAEHVYAAETMINYVYEPEVAAKIALYVNYLSPVKGVKEIVEKTDPDLANNPLVFPPDEIRKKLHAYPALSDNDERTMKEAMAQVTGA